jgi:hypothetical protein
VTCETGSVRNDDTNKCLKCNNLIPHCLTCSSQDKCDQCDDAITRLDSKGTCSSCKTENGWNWDSNKKKCVCSNFVNILGGNLC